MKRREEIICFGKERGESRHKTKTACDSFMDGTVFTQKCEAQFNKIFKTLCIPKCPLGYIDNGRDCEKRGVLHLGNMHSFDFKDMFV